MLRIIAGKYRSLKLEQPPLKITRCTTDRIREAIFSSLSQKVVDAIILDGFAGSGALAFEALSRGAAQAICIEQNLQAFKIIQQNQMRLKVSNLQILQTEILHYLKFSLPIAFDLIFLDPPFAIDVNDLKMILKTIKSKNWLKKDGLIVLETVSDKVVLYEEDYKLFKQKRYGRSLIWFLELKSED